MVILQKKIAGLSEQALARFVLRARRAAGLRGTVNVLVTSSAAMRALNRQFREQEQGDGCVVVSRRATSAKCRASAAIWRATSPFPPTLPRKMRCVSDIPLPQEIKILVLHGILHLAGFDHERDNGEMARKEANCAGRSDCRPP